MSSWTASHFRNPPGVDDIDLKKSDYPIFDNAELAFPPRFPDFCADLQRIRSSLGSLEGRYRSELHEQILLACEVAQTLRTELHWQAFIDMDWGTLRRPKITDRHRALRHVFRYVCGPSKEGQQKASFYYRALGPLMEKGAKQEELKKALNKKGLRRLAEKHSKGAANEADPLFRIVKRGKKWLIPSEAYFDRDPVDMPTVEEHMLFKMEGKVMKVGRRLSLLVYRFEG